MSVARVLALPTRYRPWRPRHARLILADLTRTGLEPAHDHRTHLEATLDWLCQAQNVRLAMHDSGSVSAGWSFEDGWLPGYPETTGYIIETFLAAADLLGRAELRERAGRMLEWELSLQSRDGTFPGHFGELGSHPVIFNTGQIMHGLLAGWREFGREDCLQAAVRAGHWLVRHQEPDGCWLKFEHNGVPHVYNTRGTWALLATGLISGERELVAGARRNLDWALSQQSASGWFRTNGFKPRQVPFTHTIAYAIRGLLESGLLLDEPRYLDAARRAAFGVAAVQNQNGSLAGTLDEGWRPAASYCCLTGVAQMALCWLRLSQAAGETGLAEHARRGIAYLKTTQRVDDTDPAVRGGIAGSSPIWGAYSRFEFPNWAAKFFADALMMEMSGLPVPPTLSPAERKAGAKPAAAEGGARAGEQDDG